MGNARLRSAGRWGDRLLERLFDWLTGLPAAEAAAMRDGIMATVMLRPGGLLLSGFSILVMSGSALALTGSRWAATWLAADLIALALRVWPTWRAMRRGGTMSLAVQRRVVASAFVVFVAFGAGCTVSFVAGGEALRITAAAAMVALAAGLSTRWAALPRLALIAIGLSALPFCLAMRWTGHGGTIQVAAAAAGTAALTLQNHRNLVAMLRAERRARLLAETDTLTGLSNRAGLLAGWARLSPAASIAVLYIDLDGFKGVNDRHGHAAGDAVLVEVSRRLAAIVGDQLTCRLGGDEFVVAATALDGAGAGLLARAIENAAAEPVALADGAAVRVSASIGVAIGGPGVDGAERLLAEADAALYAAKRQRIARPHLAVAAA